MITLQILNHLNSKIKITRKTPADGNTKDVEIIVHLNI